MPSACADLALETLCLAEVLGGGSEQVTDKGSWENRLAASALVGHLRAGGEVSSSSRGGQLLAGRDWRQPVREVLTAYKVWQSTASAVCFQ